MVFKAHLCIIIIIIITKREACGQSILRLQVFELYIGHVASNKSKTGGERERERELLTLLASQRERERS